MKILLFVRSTTPVEEIERPLNVVTAVAFGSKISLPPLGTVTVGELRMDPVMARVPAVQLNPPFGANEPALSVPPLRAIVPLASVRVPLAVMAPPAPMVR